MTEQPTNKKTPFAYTAAKLSWIAPIVVMGMNYLNRAGSSAPGDTDPETQRLDTLVLASLSLLFILCGLGLALFALATMKKYGRERIYSHAKAGLIANSIILALAGAGVALFMLT
ncbi:MAG: hypothetical protein ACIAXF_13355 [Phycisphaerales bacterium JB063]